MSFEWVGATRTAAAVVGATALAAAAAGCGSSSSGGTSSGTATSSESQTLKVALTDDGCSPAELAARSGPTTFEISSGSSGKVTELELKNQDGIILAERENVVSGIKSSFSLNLRPGRCVLSCPNGDEEDNGVLVVSGKASSGASRADARLLAAATNGYRAYIEQQSSRLLARTKQFNAALASGNLGRAKELFGPTRYFYETIEPVAESFGNLDLQIDARVNDVASRARWTGFHRIEQYLWARGTTQGTKPYGDKLVADVTTLDKRVKTLTFQPAQLANGAVELLNEVANSKITGEEDRYSHTDLSDFAANVEGAHKAFVLLRPALVVNGGKRLAETIDARFAAVDKGLDKYRRSTPLGYAVKESGAPLTGVSEHDPVDLEVEQPDGTPVIPLTAHIRHAGPAANHGERILRRGYSFTDGIDPETGQLDAGLFFVAFQRDPRRQFVPIQRRLAANDALNEYIVHTGSALFAVPPGVERGRSIGDGLLA